MPAYFGIEQSASHAILALYAHIYFECLCRDKGALLGHMPYSVARAQLPRLAESCAFGSVTKGLCKAISADAVSVTAWSSSSRMWGRARNDLFGHPAIGHGSRLSPLAAEQSYCAL